MLRLRPYKKYDAEYIAKWITDEKTFYQWSADRINQFPLTAKILNEHYTENDNNDKFWQMTAIDDEGIPRGHLIMRFTDSFMSELFLGYIVVDSSIRGKGYGKEMLSLVKKYAFEILNVKKIALGVFLNNPRAIHCYQSIGFHEVDGAKHYFVKLMGEEWECMRLVMSNN